MGVSERVAIDWIKIVRLNVITLEKKKIFAKR